MNLGVSQAEIDVQMGSGRPSSSSRLTSSRMDSAREVAEGADGEQEAEQYVRNTRRSKRSSRPERQESDQGCDQQ